MNMIFVNLKHVLRSLKSNKLFTVLNLCGFVLGLTASMILALYVYREYNVDKCFPNHENIYLLVDASNNNVTVDYDLAEMLKDRFPEVEDAVPFYYAYQPNVYLRNISNNEFVSSITTGDVTNDFFRLFSIKTLMGDPNSPFADDNSVVITASLAQKLFGRLDVVGEPIDCFGRRQNTVSAVVEDMPENCSFSKTNFFINSKKKENRNAMAGNIKGLYNPTSIYVQLSATANPDSFIETVNRSFPSVTGTDSIQMVSLAKTYLATDLNQKRTEAGSPATTKVFMGITLAIMFLSIFNYLNFSLSKQLTTLKNIGIRIAYGAKHAQLRTLFITETTLIIGFAYFLALCLTHIALPLVQTQLLNVPLNFNDLFSPTLAGISFVVLVIIVLIASLAPIYIISRFDIQSLFGKGNMRLGKQRVKQVFTTIQLAASIVLLVSLFTIFKQLSYAQSYDLGFNKERLLRLSLGRGGNSNSLKQQVDQLHFVESSALSSGEPGNIGLTMGINENDDAGAKLNIMLKCMEMDENFMKTMGIELLEGREILASDMGKSCYVSEELIKQTGWKNYEEKRINIYDGYNIIGIVSNFNTSSIHSKQDPVALFIGEKNSRFSTLSVRLKAGNIPEQMATLEKQWKEIYPNNPFQYTFYDDVFDAFYRKEMQQAKGIATFSMIALLITCMGLIGQVFQTCLVRSKEIAIRKIHGARIWDIMALFNRTFVKVVIVAFIVAVPVSYYFMDKWLQNFAYKTPLSWWVFALAGMATLVITLLVVSWQCWNTATANPVKFLKTE